MGLADSENLIFRENSMEFYFCHPDYNKMRGYLMKGGMRGWSCVCKLQVDML